MPPSVRNQQEHWRPATPACFGIGKGSDHGTKHHSQSSWKKETFLLAAQGGCHGKQRAFLGKPFAPLPFQNWRLLWLQSQRDCGKKLPSRLSSKLCMCRGLHTLPPCCHFPSTPCEGICPCVSYTITNQEEETDRKVREAPRVWDLTKGTLKSPPPQPSY